MASPSRSNRSARRPPARRTLAEPADAHVGPPWRQIIALVERLMNSKLRLWWAEQIIRHGWSQPILKSPTSTLT
jgi:hypothetical protein